VFVKSAIPWYDASRANAKSRASLCHRLELLLDQSSGVRMSSLQARARTLSCFSSSEHKLLSAAVQRHPIGL